jgi:hypothetical protein
LVIFYAVLYLEVGRKPASLLSSMTFRLGEDLGGIHLCQFSGTLSP